MVAEISENLSNMAKRFCNSHEVVFQTYPNRGASQTFTKKPKILCNTSDLQLCFLKSEKYSFDFVKNYYEDVAAFGRALYVTKN